MADCRLTEVFIAEQNRMCKFYNLCVDCPWTISKNGFDVGCENYVIEHTKDAILSLQRWSDEHPLQPSKTYADVFFEKFPNCSDAGIVDGERGFRYPVYCREILFGSRNGGCLKRSEGYHCSDCWEEPYPESES